MRRSFLALVAASALAPLFATCAVRPAIQVGRAGADIPYTTRRPVAAATTSG